MSPFLAAIGRIVNFLFLLGTGKNLLRDRRIAVVTKLLQLNSNSIRARFALSSWKLQAADIPRKFQSVEKFISLNQKKKEFQKHFV